MLEEKKKEQKEKDKTVLEEETQQKLNLVSQQLLEFHKQQKDLAAKKTQEDDLDKKQMLEAEANLSTLLGKSISDEEDMSAKGTVEDLSNKQMIEILADSVDTALGARTKMNEQMVDKKMSELNDKMEVVKGAILQMHAKTQIDAARQEFSDFDDFREDMEEVYKDPAMQSLDIKSAYILAKGRRVGKSPSKKETFSERPIKTPMGSISSKRSEKTSTKSEIGGPSETSQTGILKFRSIVDKAIDKVIASKE